jgi:hypothetical protein
MSVVLCQLSVAGGQAWCKEHMQSNNRHTGRGEVPPGAGYPVATLSGFRIVASRLPE